MLLRVVYVVYVDVIVYPKTKMVGVMVTVVALTTTAFILPMLNEKA
jgi:hypothetical protein